jgi:putative spermidine/putrescine transport system substrate-binding protein
VTINKVPRRDFLIGGGTAMAMMTALKARAQTSQKWAGKDLHVQFFAGPEGDNLTKNIVEPFQAETGTSVIIDRGKTNESIAKIRAQKSDPKVDLFLMDDVGVYNTGPQGLLEKLDLSKIPNAKDVDPGFILMDGLGIGVFTYWMTVIYNSDHFKEPPTSYEVLWDPQFKGKVALPPSDTQNAMHLIMVANLLAGGTQHDPDAGFKKLQALKPNVHSFTTDYSISAELMRKGEILLMFDAEFTVKDFIDKGYPIKLAFDIKEGIFIIPDILSLVKGHPGETEIAYAFINEALSPKAQLGLVQGLGYGPTNRTVEITDPALMKYVVPPRLFSKNIRIDPFLLAKSRQEWITRYDEALKG